MDAYINVGYTRRMQKESILDNLYCKIFLNNSGTCEQVLDIVIDIVGGTIQVIRSIDTRYFDIDVNINDKFDSKRTPGDKDDFLYWKYYLDVEPKKGVTQTEYKYELRKLIHGLRNKFEGVVPACDFEDILNE